MAKLLSGSATLSGLAHSSAGATGGISDGNHLEANANVADNDFLRVDGTEIEGRTAAETLSDIAALPKAGGTMTGNIVMGDDTSIGIADDAERIEFDGAGDIALLGCNVGIGTTGAGSTLEVVSSATDNVGIALNASSLTTGQGLSVYSSSSDSSTRSLARIWNDHASSTGTKTLEVINDTTNICCLLNQNNASTSGQILDMVFSQNLPNNTTAWFIKFRDAGAVRGYIYSDGSHVDVSDRRLKENIVDVQLMLDKVNNLRVVNFNWIDNANEKLQMGAIAQEVEEVFPHLITTSPASDAIEEVRDENGKITTEAEPAYEERLMLNKIGMIFPLVKAVQELSAKNDALEARVLALESA